MSKVEYSKAELALWGYVASTVLRMTYCTDAFCIAVSSILVNSRRNRVQSSRAPKMRLRPRWTKSPVVFMGGNQAKTMTKKRNLSRTPRSGITPKTITKRHLRRCTAVQVPTLTQSEKPQRLRSHLSNRRSMVTSRMNTSNIRVDLRLQTHPTHIPGLSYSVYMTYTCDGLLLTTVNAETPIRFESGCTVHVVSTVVVSLCSCPLTFDIGNPDRLGGLRDD